MSHNPFNDGAWSTHILFSNDSNSLTEIPNFSKPCILLTCCFIWLDSQFGPASYYSCDSKSFNVTGETNASSKKLDVYFAS